MPEHHSDGQVNSRCMDYLLVEMIANLVRTTDRKGKVFDHVNPGSEPDPDFESERTLTISDHALINRDDVTLRNESYGYHVGTRLSQIIMFKTSASKIDNILDIMKFVCRDVWKCMFNKQMDNLRTNHRGIFVLVDNQFQYIASLNSSKGVPDLIARARSFLWFPCGVIRGILATFGIEATVSAEITLFPAVAFNIQTTINN